MRIPWELQQADEEHLLVLATCWGVSPEALAETSAVWVQQSGPGDAVGPRVVQLHNRWLTVLEEADRVTVTWTHRMVGLRGLLRVPTNSTLGGARLLEPDDQAAVTALHGRVGDQDLAAASPSPVDSLLAVGVFDGGEIRGIAAVVETPIGPPEVSILVDPCARGMGLAARLERALVAAAAGRWEWLQHRTVHTDIASRALADRVGFRLVSVEYLLRPQPTSLASR